MSGDYARITFNRMKHDAGVLLQQGRVQLDSDANDTYSLLRRILLFVEDSIDCGLQSAGFEPRFAARRRRWRWF